jgi:hypothetical protein
MEVIHIYYNNQKIVNIPYIQLPQFRLLCEQYGLQTKWDVSKKRVYLEKSFLFGKTIVLSPSADSQGSKQYQQETEILERVKNFLSATGAKVEIEQVSKNSNQGTVHIQLTVGQTIPKANLHAALIMPENRSNYHLAHAIRKELRQIEIKSKIKKRKQPSSNIQIHFSHLTFTEESEWTEQREKIASALASGILRYFQKEQPFLISALIPGEIKHELATILPNLTLNPAPKQEEKQTFIKSATIETQNEKLLKAEVFLDYTIILPHLENEHCIVWGNLYIKNIGTETLVNPLICYKATPVDAIKLGGQILTPNMTETLSVQTPEGISKGWRFLEEDWFKKAKERGEYWICPIHPVQIHPGQDEIHNFQISIKKPPADTMVTVEGIVTFQEPKLQFVSNNRIAISF